MVTLEGKRIVTDDVNYRSIHRLILRNLLIGGLIISLVTGGVVSFIEYNRIDTYVAKLATESSVKYSQYYVAYHGNPTPASLLVLQQFLQSGLAHDLFVLIEIYDKALNRIIVENIADIAAYKDSLNEKFPQFMMHGKVSHKKVFFKGRSYIKVMSPIRQGDNDEIIGHFEGIYHVSDKRIAEIKNQSLLSVLQSVLIVLATTVLFYPILFQLSKSLNRRSLQLLESNINTIKSLGDAIALRDSDTFCHNNRVTIYSVRLAEELSLGPGQIQALIKGAFLHDVGKIGVSDTILLKPGKLTRDEFDSMKLHVTLGRKILYNNDWLRDAVDVVLYHHEQFDGSGYLAGLQGTAIPLNARIFAIADVFDALTSSRPYKEAFSFAETMKILAEGRGSHFDPVLLDNFTSIAEKLYLEISSVEDEQQLADQIHLLITLYFT